VSPKSGSRIGGAGSALALRRLAGAGGGAAGGAEAVARAHQPAAGRAGGHEPAGRQLGQTEALLEPVGQAAHLSVHSAQLDLLRVQQLGLAAALKTQLEHDRAEVEQQRLAHALLAVQPPAQAASLEGAGAPTVLRVPLSQFLQSLQR